MTRLFSVLFCLLLFGPAFAESMTVVSSVDWGGGMRSQGTIKTATGIVSPRDAASGLPTGKRQHKPMLASPGEPTGRPTGQRQHKLAAPKDPASGLPTKSLSSPRDAASGLPTGKRQHKPIVITKELDKASPMLMKAHQDRRILPRVVLTGRSSSIPYLKYELKNAMITSYSLSGSGHGDVVPMETLSLNFEEIKVSYR